MLYIDNRTRLEAIYSTLKSLITDNKFGFQVWKREEFPEKAGYANNTRVGDIIIMPDIGWRVAFVCTGTTANQVRPNIQNQILNLICIDSFWCNTRLQSR
jgi:hypothetical protein